MDTRILRKIASIGEIERMQERIAQATADANMVKDIEKERKSKRERETHWILTGEHI